MTEDNLQRIKPGDRVAVAMSGGRDSSIAAARLVDLGFDVVGITAHMWKEGSRCCSLEDVRHARHVANCLGIPYYVLNAQRDFTAEVVNPFVEAYVNGRTPSPCIVCNARIKFGFLLRRATALRCRWLATGHYARIERGVDGSCHLFRGNDTEKDQSYFLHRLNQEQLRRILFPVGGMTKIEALDYAKGRGLPMPHRGESQDLCFVDDGGHADFVERHAPTRLHGGPIVNTRGDILGRHSGLHRYTIGQRRGLGIASTQPLYVARLDAQTNTLVLGTRDELHARKLRAHHLNWIAQPAFNEHLRCQVRIRYRHQAAPATVKVADDIADVTFDEPQFAITPGQAAVFYQENEVLGGGWIT